ncbi:MAG: dihydroorotate dehydrogenase electron transfer subunit [candidate division Zixibacteria bacterium]|nr:dihydroorotate dehydrogenase electron transfer subunit [candidate division Zixibacteria bacterium]
MTKPVCYDTFVVKNKKLGVDYFSLTFGPYPKIGACRPGHFIQLKLPNSSVFLRRPMSVAGAVPKYKGMEIIFKVVGQGSFSMSRLRVGDPVNILGPLGVPFKFPRRNETAILVAGGAGLPPMLFLAESLVSQGFDPKRILFYYGGRTSTDIIMRTRIKRLGIHFYPVTEDGSFGLKGLVTEPLEEKLDSAGIENPNLFSCGPQGMLKAVNELGLKYGVSGQISLEAHMPCGIGMCLGCVVPLTRGGHARVCTDGPVFEIGEVEL